MVNNPSIDALVVVPMVGSVVMMLVAIGAAAAAFGAFSALAAPRRTPAAARKAP